MTVHLFGAGSSPGCVNYFVLKRIASDQEEEFGHEAANFVRDNFYVDDGLKLVLTLAEAIKLIWKHKKVVRKGRSTSSEVYLQFKGGPRNNSMNAQTA